MCKFNKTTTYISTSPKNDTTGLWEQTNPTKGLL